MKQQQKTLSVDEFLWSNMVFGVIVSQSAANDWTENWMKTTKKSFQVLL